LRQIGSEKVQEKAIWVNQLSTYYGKKKILRNISFELDKGECLGILGPNGAGKTTLIRSMMGVLPDYEGQMKILGYAPKKSSDEISRLAGYLPEGTSVYSNMDLVTYLTFFAKLRDAKQPEKTACEAIELVGLQDYAGEKLAKFSKGMIQKAKIAAAILHKPEFLILDEPTDGLDMATTTALLDYLQELKEKGMTIVICSHLPNVIRHICSSILLMNEGTIGFFGGVEEFISSNCKKDRYYITIRTDQAVNKIKTVINQYETMIGQNVSFDKERFCVTVEGQSFDVANGLYVLLEKNEIETIGMNREIRSIESAYSYYLGEK